MVHYNFLKLKEGADVEAIFEKCKTVYAELEEELDFLNNAKVCRCITERDSNADIMMIMEIDSPDQLTSYLRHPKHVALAQATKEYIADRMSFDA